MGSSSRSWLPGWGRGPSTSSLRRSPDLKARLHLVGLCLGALLLVYLWIHIGTTDLRTVLRPQLLWLVAATPVWTSMAVLALQILVHSRRIPGKSISLLKLWRLEICVDGLGRLIPSGGLVGEPWRIAKLGAVTETATPVIVNYRLLHALSGLIHLGWTVALSLALVNWSPGWAHSMETAIVLAALAALTLAGSSLLVPRLRRGLLRPGPMARALVAKVLERALQLLELFIIFRLLGISPDPARLISVAAAIIVTSSIFMIVPGGVGVNEAGITAIFTQLGLSPQLGFTVGVLRTARGLVWAGIGLLLLIPSRAAAKERAEALLSS